MKLAILSGANPRSFQRGSVIRLLPGTWRFHIHGVEDSIITVDVGERYARDITNHEELTLDIAENIKPWFAKVGTEKSITVIAERINAIRDS